MISSIEQLEGRRFFAASAFGGTGTLDTTFDGDGRGTVDFGTKRLDTVYASLVQPDGKIILVGSTNSTIGNGTDIAVARLNPDSTLDQSFGVTLGNPDGGGLFEIPLETSADNAYGVALQPDGKIVVVGAVADSSFGFLQSSAIVLRLTPEGFPDETFGTGLSNGGTGFVFVNLSKDPFQGGSSEARSVALQSDGSIIIAGAANYDAFSGSANFAVARLFSNGAVDTSFGEFGTGTEVDGIDGVFTEAYGVAVAPDQSIFITGTAIANGFSGTGGIFVTAKLNPNGIPDQSFGDEAAAVTIFQPYGFESVVPVSTSLALLPDGKILTAGLVVHADTSSGDGIVGFAVSRYLPTGQLDPSFGNGAGYVETYFGSDADGFPTALAGANQLTVLPDGRFFLTGRAALVSDPNTFSSVAVARYLSDGTLDKSFNKNGKLLLTPTGIFPAAAGTGNGDVGNFTKSAAAQLAVVPGGGILLLASQGTDLTVTRLVADGADLVTQTTLVKQGSFVAGAKSTVQIKLVNQGSVPINTTIPITVRLSADGTYSGDDVLVKSAPTKVNIKAGQTKVITMTFNYPAPGAAGQYFLVTDVNDTRGAAEGNFLNNRSATTGTVAVAPPIVSIQATYLGGPTSLKAGKKGAFSVQLINTGNVVAKGSLLLQLLASLDGTESEDDLRLLPAKATKVSLTPTKAVKVKGSGGVPVGTAVGTTYTLILRMDPTALGSGVQVGVVGSFGVV